LRDDESGAGPGARSHLRLQHQRFLVAVDSATLQIVAGVPAGLAGNKLAISPDGARLYSVGSNGGTIILVNLETLAVLPSLTVTPAITAVVAGKDGRLYTMGKQLRQISAATGATEAVAGIDWQRMGFGNQRRWRQALHPMEWQLEAV